MGALTLGIIVPAGPAPRLGAHSDCARTAEPGWESAARRNAGDLSSAADLAEAARGLGLRCEVAAVPVGSGDATLDLAGVALTLGRQLAGVDLAYVCAHAELGGTGLLHAAARACGLPALGPDAPSIELSFDKLRARERLAAHNVPVPRTVALGPGVDLSELVSALRPGPEPGALPAKLSRMGWPCVIKPRRGAAGRGVRRVAGPAQLLSLAPAEPMLIEREVVGREFSVVVLDGAVLGIAEIVRGAWSDPTTMVLCPPDLDRIARAGLEHVARRAADTLGLTQGPVRVDLLWSPRDNEVVLEVEPLPPLHRAGLVARVARAAGMPYPRLVAQLLAGPRLSKLVRSHSRPVAAPTLHPDMP
jgi:D-alanine-D-alanine ligase